MLNRFFNFYNRSQVLIIIRQVKTLDIMTNAYYFMIEKLIEKKSKYCYYIFLVLCVNLFLYFLVHDGVQTRAHHDAALFGLCFC